jgi:CheY-like chemotaxis protein
MAAVKHVILYAEDDLDDLFIVQQAFLSYGDTIELVHAANGLEALEFLKNLDGTKPLPCLIILDMNMPRMDGRETLIQIRQMEEFHPIPVVIFTTSSTQPDKDFAASWNADFITKPLMYEDLQALAKTFIDRCNTEITRRA